MVDGARTRPARHALTRAITLAAALLLAVTASGCTVLTDGLAGSSFVLTAVNEKVPQVQYVVPAEDVGRYAIAFVNDGTATITADCNQVTATYTTTLGGGLSIRPGASTMAACPDDSLGQQFVGALSLVTSYNVHGASLTMYLGNEGHMDFRLQD
ncbi:MAG TPA: META domain-containing protein [Candidatus Limnocylindrales bacterium]|nr:META domain-containing protein [Candidatus Limnocylindrales bacterium]